MRTTRRILAATGAYRTSLRRAPLGVPWSLLALEAPRSAYSSRRAYVGSTRSMQDSPIALSGTRLWNPRRITEIAPSILGARGADVSVVRLAFAVGNRLKARECSVQLGRGEIDTQAANTRREACAPRKLPEDDLCPMGIAHHGGVDPLEGLALLE